MTGAAVTVDIVVERSGSYRLTATLDARPGEIVAVMGPSGAGKTTLLGAIAGIVRVSAGEVLFDGQTMASAHPDAHSRAHTRGQSQANPRAHRHVPPARRGAVLLGQEPRLFPHLTARANVAFGLRAHGMGRADADRAADEWLWRVGLPGAGARRPAELSGGQQQRVAVARALAVEPRVLLLDEPLTSLDAETASDVRAMVSEQLARSHATVIMVTHDVIDAVAMADRLLVIEGGAVTQHGAVRDVLAAPATRFVAALAGVNRVEGRAHSGLWHANSARVVLGGSVPAASAPLEDGMPLTAVFRPDSVRLEPVADSTWTGAVRLMGVEPTVPGEWLARVVRLEQNLGGVRVQTAEPSIAVDLPMDDAAALRLTPGAVVRLRLDAAHVRLQPVEPAREPAV